MNILTDKYIYRCNYEKVGERNREMRFSVTKSDAQIDLQMTRTHGGSLY